MADLDWPTDLVPFACEFYLQPHVVRSVSPLTRAQKVYALTQPRWVCRLSLRGGSSREWGTEGAAIYGPRLDALIAKLDGGANRITLWDFRRENDGAAFTNAAISAGENEVTVLGATEGLYVGDYVGGDGRPHIITDVEVSGSDMVAQVRPHFRSNIAEGAATFERVSGLFRLTGDDAGANMTEAGQLSAYTLEFVEDPEDSTTITYDGDELTYSG